MFKKEDNVKYFIGGTALGAAAGLFVGKFLFPNMSTSQSQVFESGTSTNYSSCKRSQDDNSYNSLSSKKNMRCNYPRSKSASRYDENKSNKDLLPVTSLEKSLTDVSKTDDNNIAWRQKSNMNPKNIPCSDTKLLRNTNTKDDVEITLNKRDVNMCDKASTGVSVTYKFFSDKSNLVKSCMNDLSKTETSPKKLNCEILNISDEENTPTEISKTIEFSQVFSDLRHALLTDNSNVINNVEDNQGSKSNPYQLKTPIKDFLYDIVNLDNVSNLATFNSIIDFEGNEVEATDEFQEEELISSTKAE